MKSDNDNVALQGVEFWSTVCDEEQDLAIEAAEVITLLIAHQTMYVTGTRSWQTC